MAFSSIYCDFPELKSFQRLYEYEQFFEQILSALQHSAVKNILDSTLWQTVK